MGGFTDFEAIVGSLKAATDIVKFLRDADKALDKAEFRLKLADLMNALADARMKTADMQATLDSLAAQLAAAEAKLAFAGTMKFKAPYYWNTATKPPDGPYCAACWDGREHLAVHLYQATTGYWQCQVCENTVEDSSYQDPRPAHIEPES